MKKILNILKDSKAFQSLLYNKNDVQEGKAYSVPRGPGGLL